MDVVGHCCFCPSFKKRMNTLSVAWLLLSVLWLLLAFIIYYLEKNTLVIINISSTFFPMLPPTAASDPQKQLDRQQQR